MDVNLPEIGSRIIKLVGGGINKCRDTILKRSEDTMGLAGHLQPGGQATDRIPENEKGYGLGPTDRRGPKDVSMKDDDNSIDRVSTNCQCKQSTVGETAQQNERPWQNAAAPQPQAPRRGGTGPDAPGAGGAPAAPPHGSGVGGTCGGATGSRADEHFPATHQGGSAAGKVDPPQAPPCAEPPMGPGGTSCDSGTITQTDAWGPEKESRQAAMPKQGPEAQQNAAAPQPQAPRREGTGPDAPGAGGAPAAPSHGSGVGGTCGGATGSRADEHFPATHQGGSAARQVDPPQAPPCAEPPMGPGGTSCDSGAITQTDASSRQIPQENQGQLKSELSYECLLEEYNKKCEEYSIEIQNLKGKLEKEQSARQAAEQKLQGNLDYEALKLNKDLYNICEELRKQLKKERTEHSAESQKLKNELKKLKTERGSLYNQAKSNLEGYHYELRRQTEAEIALQREQIEYRYKYFQELDRNTKKEIRKAVASVDEGVRGQIEAAKDSITRTAKDHEKKLEEIYGKFSRTLYEAAESLYQHKFDYLARFIQNYFQCVNRLEELTESQIGIPNLKEICARLVSLESSLGGVCEELGVRLRFADSGEVYNSHLHDLLEGEPPDVPVRVKRCVAPGVDRLMDNGHSMPVLHPIVEVEKIIKNEGTPAYDKYEYL